MPGIPGETVTLAGKVRDKTYDEEGGLKSFTVGDALCYPGDISFVSEPEIGSTVSFSGTLREFREPMNKGGFDEKSYRRVRGENYRVMVTDVSEIKRAKFGSPDELCKLRAKLAVKILKNCPLEYGTIKTLILGDKSSLSDERKDLYQRVSLSHFLVISGLHISAGAGVMYRFFRRLFYRKIPASLSTFVLLVLYGLMIGFSVSVFRAVVMYGIRLLADLAGENYDTLSAAGLAATVTLVKNPLYIADSSFLYSYIAVITIGCYYDSGVVTGLKGIKEKLKDGVEFSLVMVFGMFPITMFFSGTYSLGAMVLNLFILPFGPLMLFAAFVAFLFSAFDLGAAAAFFDFTEACLIRLTDAVAGFAGRAGFLRLSGRPSVWMVFLCYGILLLLIYVLREKGSAYVRVLILSGVMKLLSSVWWWSPSLSMLYVGQGECMVLRTGMRSAAVVDCGSTSDSEVYKYDLLPFLYVSGINRIDGLFLTHSDKDHISGAEEMLGDLRLSGLSVKRMMIPNLDMGPGDKFESLMGEARTEKIGIYELSAGDRVALGDWEFLCLWPVKGENTGNANDDSLVMRGENGNFSVLLTGDISEKTECKLLNLYKGLEGAGEKGQLKADILKVPHHGSKTATSEEFLCAVRPVAAIASAGINNRYHHPAEAVREKLAGAGVDLYCTKERGETDIVPAEGNNKLIIKSYKGE